MDEEDVFTFGKYKNNSLREILDLDPSYIVWAVEKEIISIDRDLYDEAYSNSDVMNDLEGDRDNL